MVEVTNGPLIRYPRPSTRQHARHPRDAGAVRRIRSGTAWISSIVARCRAGTQALMSQYDGEYDNSMDGGVAADTRPLVLIAEPDMDCRAAFIEALQEAGYRVASISDPSRAADEALEVMPALIIA